MQENAFHAARAQSVRYLDLLSRAVSYIELHLADPLDGDSLADLAAMSRYHFQRIFRAYFGTTVTGYVTWRRLRRACELLASNPTSVSEVAHAVGYESAQALAKAMRRELDVTPIAVRDGNQPRWHQLFDRRSVPCTHQRQEAQLLRPKMKVLPALPILNATARGMKLGSMGPAAEKGFSELKPLIARAGHMSRAKSWLAVFPDQPQSFDDQAARMLCGAVFDYSLKLQTGLPVELPIHPEGNVGWLHLPAGRYAVFTHMGSHDLLRVIWDSIYCDWLPATGYALRDIPCFEHYVIDPCQRPKEAWRTDLYLPLK